MTHRLATNYAKNYCNRTLIVKVIVESVVTCFFGTRCSNRNCWYSTKKFDASSSHFLKLTPKQLSGESRCTVRVTVSMMV